MRTAADGRSRETILKIAQSGHGLSLRLSMGDGRSGWRAPAVSDSVNAENTLVSGLIKYALTNLVQSSTFPIKIASHFVEGKLLLYSFSLGLWHPLFIVKIPVHTLNRNISICSESFGAIPTYFTCRDRGHSSLLPRVCALKIQLQIRLSSWFLCSSSLLALVENKEYFWLFFFFFALTEG